MRSWSRSDTKYNSIKVKANRNDRRKKCSNSPGPTQNTIRSRWKQIGTIIPSFGLQNEGPTQNTIRSRWKQIGTANACSVAFFVVRHKIQFDQGESKSEPWKGSAKTFARSDTKYNSIKVKANRNRSNIITYSEIGPTQNTIRSRWKQIGTNLYFSEPHAEVRHKIQFDQGESKSERRHEEYYLENWSDTKYNSIKVKANRNMIVGWLTTSAGPTQNTIRSRWKQIGTVLDYLAGCFQVRHKIQFDQGESKSEPLNRPTHQG